MANIQEQEIWSLINKYDFKIDNNLHHELICVICGKILQNASQNNCGCRYCYQCIVQYLGDELKCCPGQNGDCQNQIIDMSSDITIDHFANKKIFSLIVQCPESFCQFSDSLKNMMIHIKTHEIKCPFSEFGCIQSRMDSHSINDHLSRENYFHTNLMLDSIHNLNNEINFLKENSRQSQVIIEELKIENRNLHNEIAVMKDEEIKTTYLECKFLEEEIKTIKNEIKLLKNNSQEKQKLIDELIERSNNREIILEMKLLKLENNQEISTNEIVELKKEFQIKNSDRMIDEFSSLKDLNEIYCPFEWKIENFHSIIDDSKRGIVKFIYSRPFYSYQNGYKMRLHFDPNGFPISGYTHLVVYFGIIHGEYDDKLSWPMKHKVTIGLIDQISGSIHTQESFRFDLVDGKFKNVFNKPPNGFLKKDFSYCESVLINLNVLINNCKLMRNGAILLKCFVE